MPAIQVQDLLSWSDFEELANRLQVGGLLDPHVMPYAFRGHEDAEFRIESTLHRAARRVKGGVLPPARQLLVIERSILEHFVTTAPTLLQTAIAGEERGRVAWWCLMRHYGVPTRVVDWTASIYVAGYFACSRHPSEWGAIYVLPLDALNNHMLDVDKDTTQRLHPEDAYVEAEAFPVVSFVDAPGTKIDRMMAQQGRSMLSRNVALDLEDALAAVPLLGQPPAEASALMKYRIAALAKPEIMRRLSAMNVTASSLFPGVDGIGRHLDELVRYRL